MRTFGCALLAIIMLIAYDSSSTYAQTRLSIASPQFPPYVFARESGQIEGVAVEIVAEVFQSMGIDYDNTIYPWARALHMLTHGDVHALYTMMKNEERAAVFYYPAEPLIKSKWVFFIRRANVGTLKFDSFNDLKGKRIGLVRDVKYTKALWDFVRRENNYELVPLPERNLKKLVSDRIDYTVCEYANGMDWARALGIEHEVSALTANPLESTPLYIVFSPKQVDRKFVDRFSDELKKFKSSDRYLQILEKYNISQ